MSYTKSDIDSTKNKTYINFIFECDAFLSNETLIEFPGILLFPHKFCIPMLGVKEIQRAESEFGSSGKAMAERRCGCK
jgi:hypothetical protein